MTFLAASFWGILGAFAVESSELYGAIRQVKDFPWRKEGELKLGPYIFTILLRMALGAFAAVLCAAAGPLGPAGAVAAGIAAPKMLEQFSRHSVEVESMSPIPEVSEHTGSQARVAAPATSATESGDHEGGPTDAPR